MHHSKRVAIKRLTSILRKACFGLAGIALFAVVGYAALLLYDVFNRFDWRELDWNGDGRTEFSEILAATEMGKQIEANDCIRYFSRKDGRTLKILCQGQNPSKEIK